MCGFHVGTPPRAPGRPRTKSGSAQREAAVSLSDSGLLGLARPLAARHMRAVRWLPCKRHAPRTAGAARRKHAIANKRRDETTTRADYLESAVSSRLRVSPSFGCTMHTHGPHTQQLTLASLALRTTTSAHTSPATIALDVRVRDCACACTLLPPFPGRLSEAREVALLLFHGLDVGLLRLKQGARALFARRRAAPVTWHASA